MVKEADILFHPGKRLSLPWSLGDRSWDDENLRYRSVDRRILSSHLSCSARVPTIEGRYGHHQAIGILFDRFSILSVCICDWAPYPCPHWPPAHAGHAEEESHGKRTPLIKLRNVA